MDPDTPSGGSDIKYTDIRLVFHENDEKSTATQVERSLGGSIKFIDAVEGTIVAITKKLGGTEDFFQQIIASSNTEAGTDTK